MRRGLAIGLSVLAAVAWLAPPASAQAPAAAPTPKVTITGFTDQVLTWQNNMSMRDLSLTHNDEMMWARQRFRPDIVAELGTTKLVFGMEYDVSFGNSGNTIHGSETASAGINTDVLGLLEVKWTYTEFDVPLISQVVPTRMRIGLQPFDSTYKGNILAHSDFPGFYVASKVAPEVNLTFTYAFVGDAGTGFPDGFARGDDFFILFNPEIKPFKGLDLRPIYAYYFQTGADLRGNGVGGVRQVICTRPRNIVGGAGLAAAGEACFPNTGTQNRHTVGLDARVRMGPFSLDPTFLYQFGSRDIGRALVVAGQNVGVLDRGEQDISAYIFDVRGGYQIGPLLVEAMGVYISGNKASDNIGDHRKTVRYYQALATDNGYGKWGEIWDLGVESHQMLFNGAGASGIRSGGTSMGYDKYGLIRGGARASYSLTPAFLVRSAVSGIWAAHAPDQNGARSATRGLTPSTNIKDDSQYLGTELDIGFNYKFAPGITWQVAGGYMWTGSALKAATATSNPGAGDGQAITRRDTKIKDISTIASRLTFAW